MNALAPLPDAELRGLVRDTEVHRRIYTDPAVFEQEMRRLYRAAWLYVGHESQVPSPGDYFATELARQAVVMTRHSDGRVHVLFNRCGHRGAKVVAARCGHAKALVCPYHSWTFDTDGRVTYAPIHDGARAGDFDLSAPEYQMVRLPRVESYRGFVFASFARTGPDLRGYLGRVTERIDDMVERAPDSELEIAGGCLQIVQNSNWKIFLENTHDGLHPLSTHISSVMAGREQQRALGNQPHFAIKVIVGNNQNFEAMDRLTVSTFPWGHSFMTGFRDPRGEDEVFRAYVAALEAKKGKARAEEILRTNCHNAVFYPNMTVQPSFLQLRVIFPLAVDRTRVEMWSFRLKGAPEALFERTVTYANTVHAPSSLIRPDDVESYTRIQAGLTTEGADWVSLHRDFGRETQIEGGLGGSPLSDLPIRNQYRAWLDLMTGGTAP